jgi:hypothetical protein
MGPIVLFDKSFLQSLSVDESVWFDHFFIANVCPLFYVETLADLSKSIRERRTPEKEVSLIADKFPEMNGVPSVYHIGLCINNLLGTNIPMTGQIFLAHGRVVKSDGKSGVVFERSPESEAFSRWQNQEFLAIERQYARIWRSTLSSFNMNELMKLFRKMGFTGQICKTLEDARKLVEKIVTANMDHQILIELAIVLLNISPKLHRAIIERWKGTKCPPLNSFAPYVAYVLKVELFFQISMAANLISSERPSNRIDISYLFYLPFCMIFISSDRLHEKCIPLFLRDNQEFVWGPDLKNSLAELNIYYQQMTDDIKEKGIGSFAVYPPKYINNVVTRLYDKYIPNWREEKITKKSESSTESIELLEKIRKMGKEPTLPAEKIDFDPQNPDSLLLKRSIRRTKGSWYQVSKDLKDSKDQ